MIVKTRRGGYDGKGQAVITEDADVDAEVSALGGAELVVEGRVDFDRELSLIAVRGQDGAFVAYPLVENHHAGGILRFSLAPAPTVDPALQATAEGFARRFMDAHGYVGVMTSSCSRSAMSSSSTRWRPRVHNSGHWTIEGAEVSQFENHVRACLGLPLGATTPVGSSVMVNVLGDLPDVAAVTAIAGAHLHLYGKEPRPLRKIGHVTIRRDGPSWWDRIDGGLRSLTTLP